MRIFSRKKKENTEELMLRRVELERSFDMFAALAKALLLFLIVYGAVGGFLSAYEIDYNKGFCILSIFFFALFLCAIYETRKKWLMNLINILVLFLYFYFAITNYWVINSGYYSIMNRILEVARDYLNINNGTDYALMVENEYMTVTVFALFISMVGCIFLNIHLQNKASLMKVLLLTFSPYVLPFYFGRSPSMIYMLFLFIGYTTVAILQGTNVRERLSGQMRYVLPLTAVFVILLVRTVAFLVPRQSYEAYVPDNVYKTSTENAAALFAQFGMMALFQQNTTGGGVSGGVLGQGSAVMPDYETDLIVRYTPYSLQPVYLKAFTGKNYEGTRWTEAGDSLPGDSKMLGTVEARREAYEAMPQQQGRGIMEVENVGASRLYDYEPYYTDGTVTEKKGNLATYTYYPSGGRVDVPAQEIDEAYLEVPQSCKAAVERVCREAGFEGTPEQIANQIITFFRDNYSYTLRPGFNYRRLDYITYFLLESKRGYCAHFASAGTMLFRQMGIPARYVEGYAFSYYDIIDAGELVEGAEYEDYYSGYSPIDETALIELEIPDSRAHGWVEIYIEGRGWIVVDPTPSSSETETTSFWDAFLNINENDDNQFNLGTDTIGSYLERAVGGISYVLLAVGTLAMVVLGISYLRRRQRELALPKREQARLEYERLKKYLCRKHKDFSACRTLKEQLNFVRDRLGAEISEEQEEGLYRVFFGREADNSYYEDILAFLKNLQRSCRRFQAGQGNY